jgi:hypothetical protein
MNMDLTLIPDFNAALRLDGRVFMVLGAGQGVGRQIAHALRQFGAKTYCCDADAAAAEQVAFEVSGTPLHANDASASQLRATLASLARQEIILDGVVDLLDSGTLKTCAARGRAAGQHCAQQGAGAIVIVALGGDITMVEGRFAATVADLAQEFAEDGVSVNGVVPASQAAPTLAGIAAFLCSDVGRTISGQVLLAHGAGVKEVV